MKHFFYLLLVLASSSAVNAQQWHLSPVAHNRSMYSVSVLNRSNVIIGGGNEQNDSLQDILRSESGGLVWGFSSNQGGGYIRAMDFWDEQNGLAVGYAGKILKTDNGAWSWSQVQGPVSQRNYTTVLFQDAQTVFAFGGRNYTNDTMQTIIKSTNGGSSWTVLRDQAGRWLKGAYFIDANIGFAVGAKGTIIKTTDGGANWSPVSSPVPSRDLNAVSFIDNNTGFIAGGSYVEFDTVASFRTLLKTTDGGNSWNIVVDEAGGWLTAFDFIDQNTGYLTGDGSTLYKTINGGADWSEITVTGSNWYSHFTDIEFLNEDYGVVTGLYGEVYLYSNESLPDVTTLQPTILSEADTNAVALLRANINTNGLPVTYNFIYSSSPDFSLNTGFAFLPFYPLPYTSTNSPAEFEASVYEFLPNTTYYYFATATGASGTVNGDTLSFFTDAPYHSIQTNPALSNLMHTVFSGAVIHPEQDMNLFFEYGTTTQFGSESQATPYFIDDTLDYNVTDTISTLQQNTVYYYRLKAVSQTETYYANTVRFFSGQLFDRFEVTDATGITGTSAILNAHLEGFKLPLENISFQYGTDIHQLGNGLFANPHFIDDTASYDFSVSVSSLTPDTWYYFQVSGQTEAGSVTSNTLSFYTGDMPLVLEALPATTVSQTYATLNGYAEDFVLPATLTFEYGLTPALGSSIPANPASLNDTLGHSVNAYVTNLNPSSLYWYRLAAQMQSGTIYSEMQSFNTSFSSNFFSTLPATEVTFSEAELHGMVSHFNFPVTLSFQYGLTDTFGTEVSAVPATVSDTLEHILSADISGLQDSSIYYFRLKAVSGNQLYYTTPRQVYTGAPEIINWDFEEWRTDTFLMPMQWNIADERNFERAPGHTGNYALKLTKQNFALVGYPGDGGSNPVPFFGGCAFSSRPDSITMYLNYNLHPLDSAMFLVHLYNGDEIISSDFYFFTGSSSGSFQRFSFPITYASATVPDSIVMGFTSFNAFSPAPLAINHDSNFVIIDDIGFTPAASHACNTGFENWFDFPCEVPESWHYVKTMLVNPDDIPGSLRVVKTAGIAPGNYAAEARNVQVLGMWVPGELANERGKDFGGGAIHGMPVSKRYRHLNGYYKYTADSEEDSLNIIVSLYKNGLDAGRATFYTNAGSADFVPFDIEFSYLDDTIVPDSVEINFQNNNNKVAMGYAALVIDRLSFDGFWSLASDTTGIIQHPDKQTDEVSIYPNPAKNSFTVALGTASPLKTFAELMDLNGRVMERFLFSPGQSRITIDASSFDGGIYLVRITTGSAVHTKKIVIAK